MPNFTQKQRKEAEKLVLESMDILDKSKTNSDYYRQLFSSMSDNQFYELMKKDLPFRFHDKPSVTEPKMADAIDALNFLGTPLIETIDLPYLYKNKDGKSVQSQECMVCYVPLKKLQQFVTKKNKIGVDISNRDMKTGRLIGQDKGSSSTDREFESLATLGLDKTMEEFMGPRADAMNSKNIMYNSIGSSGLVRLTDLPVSPDDSLSRNILNVYLIGAQLNSNLVNQGDYTMYTVKEKKRNVISRS